MRERYSFCDAGYIPHIRRNRRYQRQLTPEQFELLVILVRMKQAGFSNTEIKRYAKLYRQGDAAAAMRLAILTTKSTSCAKLSKLSRMQLTSLSGKKKSIPPSPRSSSLV